MNLLYMWNDSYSGEGEKKGYLFTSKFNINFNVCKRELSIVFNERYVWDFWGKNIQDVIAVVGENGSGKTMLANFMVDTLANLEGMSGYNFDFFAVFEDEEKNVINVYTSDKYKDIKVKSENYTCVKKENGYHNEFMSYKVAYFTNALSMNDYIRKKCGYIYDASLGALMHNSLNEKYEMHYVEEDKNIVINYYESEIENMIYFLYSDINKLDIPFKVPKYFEIKLTNYLINVNYIINELLKIKKNDKDMQEPLANIDYFFLHLWENILDCYNKTWINTLVINLIINLFKEICIPQTTGDNKKRQIKEFIDTLDFLTQINRNPKDDIFNLMFEFLDIVETNVYRSNSHIKKYKNFLWWIYDNKEILEDKSNRLYTTCTFSFTDDNKKIVLQLLAFYKETSFPFNYFVFDFGLSTGEFNFLNIFTNIQKALMINNETTIGSMECKDYLLFFDEADLSLHPKWQQKYVDWIVRFVSSCARGRRVQIIIATHSPIMLSDFPSDNVLYLYEDNVLSNASKKQKLNTFGSNIHTLFLNSFFLKEEGTMGAFAEKKINSILKVLHSKEKITDENKQMLKTINCIGDDLIRNKLLELYEKNQSLYQQPSEKKTPAEITAIDNTIIMLKSQLSELLRTIEKLEQMKND